MKHKKNIPALQCQDDQLREGVLAFVGVSVPRHKHKHAARPRAFGGMGEDATDLSSELIIHLGLFPFDVNLIAALFEVPPHPVAAFGKRGDHDALFDGAGVVDEGEGGGEVYLFVWRGREGRKGRVNGYTCFGESRRKR